MSPWPLPLFGFLYDIILVDVISLFLFVSLTLVTYDTYKMFILMLLQERALYSIYLFSFAEFIDKR